MNFHNPDPKPEKPVLLTGKNYTLFRMQVAARAGFKCEICGCHAPFSTGNDNFDVFYCGHVSHTIPRKKGGDTFDNAKWKCFDCHINKEHGPQWTQTHLERSKP